MSWMNTDASSTKAPNVSIATGTKLHVVDNTVYFVCLWRSASAATVPGAQTAWLKWVQERPDT
jgi:hypothetical protein